MKKTITTLILALLLITEHSHAATEGGTETKGRVKRFLVNPEGDVDGLMLENGSQINFPPHLSQSLTAIVKTGDEVKVTGIKENKSLMTAQTVVNMGSSKSVSDSARTNPPPPPPIGGPGPGSGLERDPKAAGLKEMSASGKIETLLKGPAGDVNGVILANGTIVRFPPKIIEDSHLELAVGKKISANGFGTKSEYGTAIQATVLKNEAN